MPSMHLVHAAQMPPEISTIRPYSGVRGIWAAFVGDDRAIVTGEGVCYFASECVPSTTNFYGFIRNGVDYRFEIKGTLLTLCAVDGSLSAICACDSPWPAEVRATFYVNIVHDDDNSVTVDIANYALIATVTVCFCHQNPGPTVFVTKTLTLLRPFLSHNI